MASEGASGRGTHKPLSGVFPALFITATVTTITMTTTTTTVATAVVVVVV